MIRTDFKLRYQGSLLGYLWSLAKPLMLFAILYIVFTKFLRIGQGVPNYPVSLLLGIVLWNFFTEATTGALKSVVGKGGLIRKINIPRYLVPMASIASAFINLLLNLIVVFVFILFAKDTPLSLNSLLILPILLLELAVIASAVGFFLAAFFVKYRDIEHIWDVFKQGFFYLTPILYPISYIPSIDIQKIIILNPIAQVIQDSRSVLTYGGTEQIGDLYNSSFALLIPLALVLAMVIIGVTYFKAQAKYFAEDI